MEAPCCCQNIDHCRLVVLPDFNTGEQSRETYLERFCRSCANDWEMCTRFIAKRELGFCPDFVLPDSSFTPVEIIERFDEMEEEK